MNIAKSFWGHHVNVYYVMAIPQICDTCIAKNRSKSEILYLCLNIPKNWVRRITKHDTACEQALSGTLVAGWENECPTQACSRLNIILLSQNRLQVSLFEQRGGGGQAFEHFLSPLYRDFDHELFCPSCGFLSPKRDILPNLNYFPAPRVGNLTKKLQKNSNAPPRML